MVAFIVYRSSNGHWISRYLHPTIRHCFVCYIDRGHWVSIDYALDGLNVTVSSTIPEGVYYQSIDIAKLSLRPVFPTCVGMVKHIVGINNPFILTPWQLLRSIENGR